MESSIAEKKGKNTHYNLKRKSVKILPSDMLKLEKFINGFIYRIEAEEALKTTQPTLDNILKKKQCAPKTIVRFLEIIDSLEIAE